MSWTFIEDTKPKARKEYKCILCERIITKGEIHVRRFGYSCRPISARMHVVCEDLTRDWDETDWEHHDVSYFRELLESKNL